MAEGVEIFCATRTVRQAAYRLIVSLLTGVVALTRGTAQAANHAQDGGACNGKSGWYCGLVGLFVSPPAHAIVLSVDKKSQIQLLGFTHDSAHRILFNF